MKKDEVILLLSGGIDSTTLLALLSEDGKKIHALSFDYGQRHRIELDFAVENAKRYGVSFHHILKIDFFPMSEGNSLTGDTKNVHKDSENPNYVPGRNLLMLSYASAYAESKRIQDIYFAANGDDGQNFPDCRTEFLKCLNRLWQTCSNTSGLKLHTPFISLSKAAVIKKSYSLGVDLKQTISCYAPNGTEACGVCMSCLIRSKAIEDVEKKI